MKIDTEIENQEANFLYEQPSLKKYGTMKEMTLSAIGSGSDGMGNATLPDIDSNRGDRKRDGVNTLTSGSTNFDGNQDEDQDPTKFD